MPGKLDLCRGDLIGLGPLWFTSNQLPKDSLFWSHLASGAPRSLANSSSQNRRSFHTVRCVFPADSSYPSEAKWMPGLEGKAATQEVDSVCYRMFPWFSTEDLFFLSFFLLAFELSLYLLPGGSFALSCRSLVRRCCSLARTCGHYSLTFCQPKPQTLQVTVSQASFGSQAMVM